MRPPVSTGAPCLPSPLGATETGTAARPEAERVTAGMVDGDGGEGEPE